MLVLTYAENILKNDKFAFKGDKSRVVRSILTNKSGPHLKKV
jgi:hypothetical protein